MGENLKLIRPYLAMLALVTVGRWLLSVFHVPYEKGTDKLSIVTLTIFASLFFGAFCRRWRGARILGAMSVAMTMGVISQLVVLLSTVVSYAFAIDSYFTHPRALGSPQPIGFGEALVFRLGGLVVNTILSGIAGALGWVFGMLLPEGPNS